MKTKLGLFWLITASCLSSARAADDVTNVSINANVSRFLPNYIAMNLTVVDSVWHSPTVVFEPVTLAELADCLCNDSSLICVTHIEFIHGPAGYFFSPTTTVQETLPTPSNNTNSFVCHIPDVRYLQGHGNLTCTRSDYNCSDVTKINACSFETQGSCDSFSFYWALNQDIEVTVNTQNVNASCNHGCLDLPTTTAGHLATTPESSSGSSMNVFVLIGIIAGAACGLVLLIGIIVIIVICATGDKKKKKKKKESKSDENVEARDSTRASVVSKHDEVELDDLPTSEIEEVAPLSYTQIEASGDSGEATQNGKDNSRSSLVSNKNSSSSIQSEDKGVKIREKDPNKPVGSVSDRGSSLYSRIVQDDVNRQLADDAQAKHDATDSFFQQPALTYKRYSEPGLTSLEVSKRTSHAHSNRELNASLENDFVDTSRL
ncbi:uncharacterized protein LOC131943536 [Physella acuta]|uniref:uncharacterized protein LOC131943536 n=1 Tax=Physella acuta TaxID=109671 RepID=UPI0027DE6EE2|nr:uncharacterized protein LOC131943536 [Physella acuta]